jgi:hypothetical protein
MRKIIVLLVLFSTFFHGCELLNLNDPLAIDGIWAWTEAIDKDGDDLLKQRNYQSCTFYKGSTYEIFIDSTLVFGNYLMDENNTILRMDHSSVWEVMNFSDSSFIILNLTEDRHKWELKKIGDVTK